MLLKRGASGQLPLHAAVRGVMDEVLSSSRPAEPSGPFAQESHAVDQAKKILLFVAGAALQKYPDSIREEQELLMHLSNIVMEIYAMDSARVRASKYSDEIHTLTVQTLINDALSRVEFAAKQALAAVAEGDALRVQLAALRRLLRWTPVNTIRARQRIAEYLLDHDRYAL
jgi:hypothetical protein